MASSKRQFAGRQFAGRQAAGSLMRGVGQATETVIIPVKSIASKLYENRSAASVAYENKTAESVIYE